MTDLDAIYRLEADDFIYALGAPDDVPDPEEAGTGLAMAESRAAFKAADASPIGTVDQGGGDGPGVPWPENAPETVSPPEVFDEPDLPPATVRDIAFFDGYGMAKGGNGGGGGGGGGGGKPGSGGDTGVVSEYVSGQQAGALSDFNIKVVFKGTWTEALQQSFIDASELLSAIIRGDIPDVSFRGKIDDVTIDASLEAIDGEGGVLGQAGPSVYRTASFLPAAGIMQFDVADAEVYDGIGLFNDIVFHEMMHVLGFGTMWDNMGLVTDNGATLDFNGTRAAATFAAEFGGSAPSVETEGGGGTAGSHWNEDGADGFAFENEIMTGYIDAQNYLSSTTIAALEDMGYDTVWDSAAGDATAGLDLSIFSDNILVG